MALQDVSLVPMTAKKGAMAMLCGLVLLWVILLPLPSLAATIYADNAVSMGGTNCLAGNYSLANRNCTGSDGNAYIAWENCADAIGQNDKCYIRAGTYTTYLLASALTLTSGSNSTNAPRVAPYPNETVTIKPQHPNYNLYLNGTLAWFTFGECDGNHTVRMIFDGTGMTGSFAPVHLISSNDTHIKFSCIKITNTNNTSAGIFVADGSNNGVMEYSEFTGNGNHDIYVSADGWLIEHNWFHSTGGVENNAYNVHLNDSAAGGSSNNHQVQFNLMENVRNGILMDGNNNLAYRNEIRHVTAFDGIMVGYSSNNPATPNLLYHNLIYDVARQGIRLGEFCGEPGPCSTVNTHVKNNVALLTGGGGIVDFHATGTDYGTPNSNKTTGLLSDCFVNASIYPAVADYTLKANAPCINVGIVLPNDSYYAPYPFNGVKPDQGPTESGAPPDTTPPGAPTGLTISRAEALTP